MKKIAFIFTLLLALFSTVAFAANTTTCNGRVITIVPDGSTDWYLTQDGAACGMVQSQLANGIYVQYIMFIPSLAADRLVLLDSPDGQAYAPVFMDTGAAADTGALMWRPPDRKKLGVFLDISHGDITLDTAASAKIIIGYE